MAERLFRTWPWAASTSTVMEFGPGDVLPSLGLKYTWSCMVGFPLWPGCGPPEGRGPLPLMPGYLLQHLEEGLSAEPLPHQPRMGPGAHTFEAAPHQPSRPLLWGARYFIPGALSAGRVRVEEGRRGQLSLRGNSVTGSLQQPLSNWCACVCMCVCVCSALFLQTTGRL